MNSNNKSAHKNLVTKKIGNHSFVFDVNGRVIIQRCLVEFINIEDLNLGKIGVAKKIVQDKVLIGILVPNGVQYVWCIGDQLRLCDDQNTPVATTNICEVHQLAGDSDSSDDYY